MARPSKAPAAAHPLSPDARTILESIGDAFYAADEEWRLVYANRRALERWGRSAEEVLGRRLWDVFPSLLGSASEQALREAVAEGRARTVELRSPALGRWIAASIYPGPHGVSVFWRDIEDRVAAERALRRSEDLLRLASEAAGTGTWDWDLERNAIRWSPEMFRLFGLPPETPDLHAAWLEVLHPEDRPAVVAAMREAASRPGPFSFEFRVLRPGGEPAWILGRGNTVVDAEGRPVRMLGITLDLTERRRTEEALRDSETRLRLAQRAAGLGSFDWRLPGGSAIVSEEYTRIHGLPPGQAVDTLFAWRARIHPEDRARVVAGLAAALAGATYDTAYRIFREDDGEERRVASRAEVLRDAEGRPQRVIGTVMDVTERRRIEEDLRRLNEELESRVREEVAAREAAQRRLAQAERMEALGQLAGGIAHDFNNVLQAVQGALALIARRPEDPQGVARLAQMGLEATGRGASVTRRLLAFSRRDALRAEAVDIAALFRELREVLVHTLGAGIAVELDVAPRLPPILADRGQLETVLVNLATNARDAMPQGGVLRFVAAPEQRAGVPPRVCIQVTDSGTGMDAATLARASEPFFTTKPVGKGTGLGLAMARGFAEQSNGGFRIESRPGQGTTVALWLPVAAAVPATAAEPGLVQAPRRPARLLLVEDDPLVRGTLAAELEAVGYAVSAVCDAEAALALLAGGSSVHLLVSDLSMPGMDGLSLIREAQRRQPALPAILLTGHAEDAPVALSAVATGMGVLRKPVTGAQLQARIAALLRDGAPAA